MKKSELRIGQILLNNEDNITPYCLVISINAFSVAYLRSHTPESFWIRPSDLLGPMGPMIHREFKQLRNLKVVDSKK